MKKTVTLSIYFLLVVSLVANLYLFARAKVFEDMSDKQGQLNILLDKLLLDNNVGTSKSLLLKRIKAVENLESISVTENSILVRDSIFYFINQKYEGSAISP